MGTSKLRRITLDWFAGMFITIWVTFFFSTFYTGRMVWVLPHLTKPSGVSVKHHYFYIKTREKASTGCLEED